MDTEFRSVLSSFPREGEPTPWNLDALSSSRRPNCILSALRMSWVCWIRVLVSLLGESDLDRRLVLSPSERFSMSVISTLAVLESPVISRLSDISTASSSVSVCAASTIIFSEGFTFLLAGCEGRSVGPVITDPCAVVFLLLFPWLCFLKGLPLLLLFNCDLWMGMF